MERFFTVLRSEEQVENSMHWLYKGPSYSMAVYKQDNKGYVLSLLPHLMPPTNWLAAMGIFEARQGEDSNLDEYRIAARRYIQELGAASMQLPHNSLEGA